jgi:hypothetical protein
MPAHHPYSEEVEARDRAFEESDGITDLERRAWNEAWAAALAWRDSALRSRGEVQVVLTEEHIDHLLDWTEGDADAEECGRENCTLCDARALLVEAKERLSEAHEALRAREGEG